MFFNHLKILIHSTCGSLYTWVIRLFGIGIKIFISYRFILPSISNIFLCECYYYYILTKSYTWWDDIYLALY